MFPGGNVEYEMADWVPAVRCGGIGAIHARDAEDTQGEPRPNISPFPTNDTIAPVVLGDRGMNQTGRTMSQKMRLF